jgi:hypothetical protein
MGHEQSRKRSQWARRVLALAAPAHPCAPRHVRICYRQRPAERSSFESVEQFFPEGRIAFFLVVQGDVQQETGV